MFLELKTNMLHSICSDAQNLCLADWLNLCEINRWQSCVTCQDIVRLTYMESREICYDYHVRPKSLACHLSLMMQ